MLPSELPSDETEKNREVATFEERVHLQRIPFAGL